MVDLVAQISERARRSEADPEIETDIEARTRARLRAAVDLDDERAYELQDSLGLAGDWNVTPQDLVGSREGGGIGALLGIFRRLVRPGLKLFANFDRPLYKQFKVNLGVADALHELLHSTAELDRQLQDVSRRLEALEARDSASVAADDTDSD